MKLPSKLSAAQRQQVQAVADAIVAQAMRTDAVDRAATEQAIANAYALLGLPAPQVQWHASPAAAMRALQRLAGDAGDPAKAPMAPPMPAMEELMRNPAPWVFETFAAARHQDCPALGDEVDLSFNQELNQVLFAAAMQPGWGSVSDTIDRRLSHLIFFAHAVSDQLEAHMSPAVPDWLLSSGAHTSLWNAAEDLARVQALAAIGALPEAPVEARAAHAVLTGCGWVHAYEKVCMVCERPSTLTQRGRASDRDGVHTEVHWPDGAHGSYHYAD